MPAEPSLWQPVLTDAAAAEARRAIDEIAAALAGRAARVEALAADDPFAALRSPSLGTGSSGAAIFLAYLHLAGPDEGDQRLDAADEAMEYLEAAIGQMGRLPLPPVLYEGFLGVGWTARHLEGKIFESDEGEEDPFEEVDEAVRQVLRSGFAGGDYDLIRGLVGLGVYALERLPRPAAHDGLRLLIGQLEERAREESPGLAWWTPPELALPVNDDDTPPGHYNLGVAHGVPGAVGLLAELVAADVESERCQALLEGAVDWMLGQQLEDGARSCFPGAVLPGREPLPTRTAWCYGDPGVAAVLLNAGRAAGRRDWEERAVEVAAAALGRPVEATGVVDAGLCHGAAGLAHLANRFYQATRDARFRDLAAAWFERALDMRRPGEGVGGFTAWSASRRVHVADPGFLTGAAGVGLALLAATSHVEPSWDRLLLISISPIPWRLP